MKNLIILTLLFLSSICSAQRAIQVEDIISTLDSLQQSYFKDNVEDCVRLYARYGTRDQISCPVYLDEQGYYFYVYVSPQKHIYFITLSKENDE